MTDDPSKRTQLSEEEILNLPSDVLQGIIDAIDKSIEENKPNRTDEQKLMLTAQVDKYRTELKGRKGSIIANEWLDNRSSTEKVTDEEIRDMPTYVLKAFLDKYTRYLNHVVIQSIDGLESKYKRLTDELERRSK